MDSLLSTLISLPILWFIYYLVFHLGHCCKSTLDWVTHKINFSVSEIRKSKMKVLADLMSKGLLSLKIVPCCSVLTCWSSYAYVSYLVKETASFKPLLMGTNPIMRAEPNHLLKDPLISHLGLSSSI